MTLHKFPPFVTHNVISDGPTNGLCTSKRLYTSKRSRTVSPSLSPFAWRPPSLHHPPSASPAMPAIHAKTYHFVTMAKHLINLFTKIRGRGISNVLHTYALILKMSILVENIHYRQFSGHHLHFCQRKINTKAFQLNKKLWQKGTIFLMQLILKKTLEQNKQAFSVKRYPPPMMACLWLMACLCMKVFMFMCN